VKTPRIAQLSVTLASEMEEPVAALLERFTGEPPVSFRREGAKVTELSCYLRRSPAKLAALREKFSAGLQALREMGLKCSTTPLILKSIPKEDWAESWKKHFPPLEIGSALLLKPSWNRRKAKPGQVELILDPGLSFGTGHHPTTEFCLRQVVKWRPRKQPRSLLDMGTGTGILAIAAVKLGYLPVRAFDFDPESVRVAGENAAANDAAAAMKITRKDLTRLPLASRERYDVVCANMEFDLLLRETNRILNRLKPGGVLVLAGILKKQYAQVRQAYEKAGLKMIATRGQKEWQSGAFQSASTPV
jgi:ribosomal protein L11 methyltransferase